jgi:hypothetical protein
MYDSFSVFLDLENFSRSLEERLCDRILHVSNFQHLFYISHLQVMSPLLFCFPTNIIFHSSKNPKEEEIIFTSAMNDFFSAAKSPRP